MQETLMPDWIRNESAQRDSENAQLEAAAQKQLAGSLLIQTRGPESWRQLLREIDINIEFLPKLHMYGSTSHSGDPAFEDHYRVIVALDDNFPKQTYTDLFYAPGSNTIRCHTFEEKAFKLRLQVLPEGGIGFFGLDDSMRPMTPERAAQAIVKRMADYIRSR